MNKTVVWAGIAIVAIGGLFFWMSRASAPAVDQGAASSATPAASGQNTGAAASEQSGSGVGAAVSGDAAVDVGGTAKSVTITYDGNAFSPASVTIAKDDTVSFVDTAGSMWIGSDPHPVHTGYDGTSRSEHCASGYTGPKPFDQCAPGANFSFTFDKTGSWGYHDHLNEDARGTVVVK